MKKTLLIFFLFMLAIPSGFAQLRTYSFEEVEQLSLENPKPIVVFVHTNWCKYCKMMENTTFKNKELINELNTNFYFVLFDAESKNDIIFNKHTFKFKPTGQNTGIHELATALATVENQVVYPTLTILDPNYSILFQKQSFLKAKDLLSILEKIKEFPIFEKNSSK
ncbi:Thioredoxin-related protein [Flavobacterium gillisiae]|uniref:Thioredoxin-related protein n=1 Tax=Flavobacterium gillisiae TaxID=150146 RepID=A0A1H3Z0B7_9FLAO|nr:thioredoxin fold domain-containing protein [Flavobacterium gillisiae]SEA16858.1 Thioredoxin-related protein [Flavobacterium gillisiae]